MKIFVRLGFITLSVILFSGAPVVYAEEASSSVAVHVTVIASGVQLFDADVNAVACDSDGLGTMAFTAYCALSQAEASSTWSWWGSDAFLDSVNGVTNDSVNGWYWGWFVNLVYGETAMNKYAVAAGDHLLVLLNTAPLRLSVSSLTPTVGETVSFTAEEFGYDAAWNPVWKLSPQSHLMVGATDIETDASGTYVLAVAGADPITVRARKDGNFAQSPLLTITPVAVAVTPAAEPVAVSSGGSGSSAPVVADKQQFDLQKAVDFLLGFQDENGSFGDQMYTDWAAIALKAATKAGNDAARVGLGKVKDYLVSKQLSKSASLTDNERHALALMAVGINPYTGTDVDYIQRIVDAFDGEQFGDSAIGNDDIFALLVLLKAGYKTSDEMMQKAVDFLISKQASSGAWIGVDVTAAAIQALRSFSEAAPAVARAEEYIKSQQLSDGGFGNVYSLSWALQALGVALPGADDALGAGQQEDGGFRKVSASDENRLWATAYAISGALHKSWPDLMSSYKKIETVKKDDELEEEVGKAVESESAPEAPLSLPALLVSEPEVVPRAVEVADTSTPVATGLQAEDVWVKPLESVPLVASAIDVTGKTSMPVVPIELALLGALMGFFVLRAL